MVKSNVEFINILSLTRKQNIDTFDVNFENDAGSKNHTKGAFIFYVELQGRIRMVGTRARAHPIF